MIIILDLDNTIADDAWRIPRINWQQKDPFLRYHDYHSLSAFDNTGNTQLFVTGMEAVILTARPVHYRSITEEWLQRKGLNYGFLLMRNNDDHCHSRALKRKQLNWLLYEYGFSKSDIACAYDDREDVVQMYRDEGVIAQRLNIHDVCAYTNPNGEVT